MTYTKDDLRQIFQKPFNANEWQQILQHYFHATELRAEPELIDGTTDDEQGYYLGAIDTTDSYRIGLFYYQIRHGNVVRKRVGLRNLVKSFINPNWGEFDAALVVFDSGSAWRLSFVCDIKGENTAPKRHTYVFGEGDSFYNTPVGRFDALQRKGISFENIKDAFSVEALSKEFFDEYREHYADIVEYITGKRYVKEKGKWVEKIINEPCNKILSQFSAVYKDPEKTVRNYIKKLMGRLVFLQFLQKKEWMGVPADRQDWKGGDTRFLQNKFNEFADKDNFIDGFLEPLFNDLNTNRQNNNDLASPKVGSDIKIPFLNGGLFQLDEEDCSNICLPQHLLGDVLDFFERYNFTIDENDPNDAQIGVDPEMLGRVFENLLEDNKDKGAFYTPKEIVQYMCQESLIAYLQTGIDDESNKESIRQFVLTHEVERLGSMAEDISIKLLNVKICDPAIGSGAFPMGLLRQLYLCQCAIRPELEEKNAADIKRHIIQNNIYGVDIEKGAVDIARLRFWLSLIVDEETPRFLPNLDFKIMQGNSLLEQYKGADLSKMTELKSEKHGIIQTTMFDDMLDVLRFDLRQKLDEYYNCSDHHRKERLKQEIIDNVKQQLREQSINVDFGDLDLSANDQFTLWHTWFYDVFSQGGFDIVIGNPPYFQIPKRVVDVRMYPYSEGKDTGKQNIYKLFIEQSYNLSVNRGVVCLITQSSIMCDKSAQFTRELLLTKTELHQVIEFPKVAPNPKGQLFENALVGTSIMLFKKAIADKNHKFSISNNNDLTTLHIFDFAEMLQTMPMQFYPNGYYFPLIRCKDFAVIETIIKQSDLLIKYIKKTSQGDFNLTNEKFCFSTQKTDVKMFRGCHIHRYYIDNEVEEYIQKGHKKAVIQENEKKTFLVCQNISGMTDKKRFNMAFSINQRCLFGHSVDKLELKDDVNPKFILAIINSNVIDWYFRKTSTNNHVNIYELEQLPIPTVTATQQQPIIALVEKILVMKQVNALANTNAEETAIDLLVYHLYGLTYDEVLIVDPETPITREEYER